MRLSLRESIAALLSGFWVLMGASASAQRTTPVIALAAGTCPAVTPESVIFLEWNPGFTQEYAVTGIQRFALLFGPATGEGGSLLRHPNGDISGFSLRASSITALPNGFYHFEFHVRGRIAPGAYMLASAAAAPILAQGYQGPAPQMTNSPATQMFCFKVADRTPAAQSFP